MSEARTFVPVELLERVLDAAEQDCLAVYRELGCTPEDRVEFAGKLARIGQLRAWKVTQTMIKGGVATGYNLDHPDGVRIGVVIPAIDKTLWYPLEAAEEFGEQMIRQVRAAEKALAAKKGIG